MRIVSLVPSLTELLCALGLREQLVGRTGFCIHPRDALRDVPKVGGTKDVDVERIRALAPTHVVVNVDENEKPTVERIARFVANVVVTHPLDVDDNLALIESFGETFERRDAARELADRHRDVVSLLRSRRREPLPVLYLIWKDPWMTVGRDTFIANMLAEAGLQSVIATSDPRYPVLHADAIPACGARAVLLSSEPYRFTERHRHALQRELNRTMHDSTGETTRESRHDSARDSTCDSARDAGDTRAHVPVCATIDGSMTSWYGSRAIDGLRYLNEYREELDRVLARTRSPEKSR